MGTGAAVAHLVGRERRARRRSERAAADTLRLESVARALAEARTPQQVLDAILTEGLAAAEARAGLIGVLSEDGDWVEVTAHRGYESVRFDRWGRFGVHEQLPLSEAIRTARPVFLASTAERDRRYPALAGLTESSHALACLPLVFEGRTLGGLVLSFPRDQEFDAERRALKEALAAQAAQALDRARLDEAERELRERLVFLAEASSVLASSLDYELTLHRLAELCVSWVADWCAIDVLAPDGGTELLAVAARDPARAQDATEPAERYPGVRGDVPEVLQSGEPRFLPEITEELRVAEAGGDSELLEQLRELDLRSRITVPLVARGRALGALSLVLAGSERRYKQADFDLALEVARRAAVALDNARLHREVERRADAARALQHVADAVVLVGSDGSPRYWNQAADALLGGDGALADWAQVRPVLRDEPGPAGAPVTVPVELRGHERWLEVSRVDFEDGRVYALRDVTEERLLEQTRSEFVATASHELRTPIAAVYGTFQTLLRDDVQFDPEQQEQFLRLGLQESERLRAVVDDLLLAGQLDAGAPQLSPTGCDVGVLLDELADSTRLRLDGTHRLAVAVPAGLELVECDPMRLRQVLANLVENAVKYSPGGGTITVSASSAPATIRIEVSDEGIGIAEGDQARIFERFVRLDPALSRGVGGTGLGLYICRELVQRMHGRISVRSREGEGSTFAVELPSATGA
jgi:signal transduction histidine kinase